MHKHKRRTKKSEIIDNFKIDKFQIERIQYRIKEKNSFTICQIILKKPKTAHFIKSFKESPTLLMTETTKATTRRLSRIKIHQICYACS